MYLIINHIYFIKWLTELRLHQRWFSLRLLCGKPLHWHCVLLVRAFGYQGAVYMRRCFDLLLSVSLRFDWDFVLRFFEIEAPLFRFLFYASLAHSFQISEKTSTLRLFLLKLDALGVCTATVVVLQRKNAVIHEFELLIYVVIGLMCC